MESIFEGLVKSFAPDTKLYELSAIWMTKPVITGTGERTVRLTPGMHVKVKDGYIEDCPEATHRIDKCIGTIGDHTLLFEMTDLNTNEPFTLKVK